MTVHGRVVRFHEKASRCQANSFTACHSLV